MFASLAQKFDGAYNLVYLNALGDLVVLRDPLGIRPLCVAQEDRLFAAASESVALQNLGFETIRSLEPGEMVVIQDGQVRCQRFAKSRPPAHCFFEWIYFANVASVLDDRSVYLTRSALGDLLARQEWTLGRVPLDDNTVVVPVPDTGKAAADAMAYALKVKSVEGLIRNRYVGRTFIENENRTDRVRLKYTPLREVLAGKRVLLIEDTIVRSTTMKSLLHHIRERGGAKEIHVRVACPPIVARVFMASTCPPCASCSLRGLWRVRGRRSPNRRPWHASWVRTVCTTCHWKRWRRPSARMKNNCAGRA